ncbi:MAG: hypothetical protein AB8G95_07235 [Anaerolineae bacterium]
MSNDTHDQNKGLETPDTAPSRMRVIAYALVGYLLVACVGYFFLYGIGIEDDRAGIDSSDSLLSDVNGSNSGSFPPAAYLVSSGNSNLISEQIQLGNLQEATNQVELATVLGTYPRIRIIFIDDAVLANEAQLELVKEQFDAGKMIVGLRTSHAKLSQALGLPNQLPDLEQAEKATAVIWISAWYTDENGDPAEISQSWDQFPTMMSSLHILAKTPQ